MQKLPGYNIESLLHESHRSSIFRGCRRSDLRPVIIKILRPDMCSSANINRLAYEFEILKQQSLPGVLRALDFERRGLALIMDDEGGTPLPDYLLGRRPGFSFLLELFVQMAESIRSVHDRGLVHGDLHPSIFLLHPREERLVLAGCGAAIISGRELKEAAGFQGRITANLAYIAPEQSGCLTGGVDQRSDLYSLGIIAYEIFSGRRPFEASNPYQWIKAHMRGQVLSPRSINRHIPGMFAAIIMKLLARNPEERYQTIAGLLADIIECRRQLQTGSDIAPFALGQEEKAGAGLTAMRLYGREKETAVLLENFEMLCRDGNQRIILVSGTEGSGKTALVTESLERPASEQGYFLHVKLESAGSDDICKSLIFALQKFSRQFSDPENGSLNHSPERRAASPDFAINPLLDLKPELNRGSVFLPESGRRLLNKLQSFLQWLPGREHPVVLFLDDLQWADAATLHLLRSITAAGGIDYLMVVGTFCGSEAEASRYLQQVLAVSGAYPTPVVEMHLEALPVDDMGRCLANALAVPEFRVQELNTLLYNHIRGNPLHMELMLQHLMYEKQLWFADDRGAWEWNGKAIQAMPATEDLLSRALKYLFSLPPECRAFINLGALMGRSFDLDVLAWLTGQATAEIRRTMEPAIKEGLIQEAWFNNDGTNADLPSESCSAVEGAPHAVYEFLHWSIRQAAEMMVSSGSKSAWHLKIGRILLAVRPAEAWIMSPPGMEPALFHLNRARDLLTEQEERLELAEYNLKACRFCLGHGSPEAAWHYCGIGLELLPVDAWKESPALARELHREGAHCAGLTGNSIAAASLFSELHRNCTAPEEKLNMLQRQMAIDVFGECYANVVDRGLEALGLLGMRASRNPSRSEIGKETRAVKGWLRGNHVDTRLAWADNDWPVTGCDPDHRQLLEILSITCGCALEVDPDLFILLTACFASRARECEGSSWAGPGYAAAAFVADYVLEDKALAGKLRSLALGHPAGRNEASTRCMTGFFAGALLEHRSGTFLQAMEHLRLSIEAGRKSGSILYPVRAYDAWLESAWLAGVPLEELRDLCRDACAFAVLYNQQRLLAIAHAYLHLAEKLMGFSPEISDIAAADGVGAQTAADPEPVKDGRVKWTGCFASLIWQYLQGDWETARVSLKMMAESDDSARFSLTGAEFDFYSALILAGSWEDLDRTGRRAAGKDLGVIQKRLEKRAVYDPDNYLIQHLLVEAEAARLKDQNSRAEKYYDRAMEAALAGGRSYYAGLAAETAARHHLAAGHDQMAGLYVQEAGQAYKAWGASAKLRQMERSYPGWLGPRGVRNELRPDHKR